ncbi:MaoC/PaaZ C-terminal domain-containing protein [Cryptosporangium arvum]|jgi:acyl dehydratase|uniref:MaoC/PaaZ C-terminal domain-containing protein n=1 Tax=Cryptosporangium arvum TaxID=80871 RepID=UPI0004B1E18D|nr:MaoC/PaaZ C-terminal domain-containing protein [Cryptosporangium arvum]
MTQRTSTAPAEVGEELPPFVRTTGFETWNRYAAVNDEFVPIHMDDEAGRAAGYPTAFGMGNLQWSYLHALVRGWLAGRGRIVALSCQFRNPNLKGQTVTARGVVEAVHEDGTVELTIWTENQDGAKLAPGKATVAFD